jgi:4-amino-4-deoxy-L-arabinose transferase-like glycosyltransferase
VNTRRATRTRLGAALRRNPIAAWVRATLRRIPTAAWVCALVACLNAACWSLITPPFQVPDEPSHFAYVQELAQTGSLPRTREESFSPAEEIALDDLNQPQLRYNPQAHTIFTQAQQRQLEHDLALPYSRVSPNAGVATSEPPLYYALETIPYYLGSGGTILDSDALMRLFSSLMAGLTALFAFLFIRETLPGAPWAWTVGGLGVALAPLLALMSGAVNPDAQLYAVSAALCYCLGRGFRRGLTPKLAVAIGATVAIGFLTKLNFLGLIPGTVLGLIILTGRAARTSKRMACISVASAFAVAGSPICLYVTANLLAGRPPVGTLSNGISLTGAHGSILKEASYIWQFYLPKLPGMHSYFPHLSTTIQLWFDNFVGLYGWFDTVFPAWVYKLALIPAGLIAALVVSALIGGHRSVRGRICELSVYLALTIGLMALVGANDYLGFPSRATEYAQPRYLLPLLALYGATLALAARGAGRRWGPVVGASIVVLFIAHDLFSGLLEISRYYYG